MTAVLSHAVAPEDIQKELNRIWESLETINVARACLFNLLFYTKKDNRAPYIQRIAQKVVEKFPSRVIFVTADSSAKEDALKTTVSILPSSKGEFDVSCDYIAIETKGAAYEKIPFLVLPLILPDLPVYLFWGQDLSEKNPLFSPLEQLANRLIFDSEMTDDLPRFASDILQQRQKLGCDIADLNWARMESWREMLSMAFYSEDKLKQIRSSKKIAISYNAHGTPFFSHTHIQAIYLQAWLACQLNWNFQSLNKKENVLLFSYKGEEGPVEIAISPASHGNLPPGLILSVEISTAMGESFSFKRHPEMLHQVTYQHTTKEACSLPFQYILSKAESGHSLVKEICHRGTSEHFLKILNFVKGMDKRDLSK